MSGFSRVDVRKRDIQSLLLARVRSAPRAPAFTFLVNGEEPLPAIDYAGLDAAARARAAALVERGLRGRTVLLAYDGGEEFQIAFLACVYAGVIAVPTPVPVRTGALRRTTHIARDAMTTTVLTDMSTRERVAEGLGEAATEDLDWLVTDEWTEPAADWHYREIDPDDVALLQYTSGSTGDPKGVMVTHANLWHQAAEMDELWTRVEDGAVVSWLPMFHDMGLLFGLVFPVFTGMPAYLLSPEAFVRKPVRWLRAISRFRATHAIAPNFAYERCVSHISAEERRTLDLSGWKLALSGAEPVRSATLARFARTFAETGLDPNALGTGYGLAEATLKVAGSTPGRMAGTLWLSAKALQEGRAVPVGEAEGGLPAVTSGRTQGDTVVRIVAPDSSEARPEGRVGEIWIRGSSVTKGYWNRPEQTAATFHATIRGEGPQRYLRTGDLGFLHDGELYVTGRHKDLLIFNGENHYPQDIEYTAEESHPGLRVSSACAIGVDHAGAEKLVVVVEVDEALLASAGADELAAGIESAVWREHELAVHRVVPVRRNSLPRTTSGKIQRTACRLGYEQGRLKLATGSREPARVEGLLAWLREFGARRVDSRLMDERRTIAPHIVLALGRKGLLGMQIPSAYGGLGLDTGATLRVLEQLAAIDLTLATFVCDNNALGVYPIARYGSAELKAALLPDLASGRSLAAFAVTEPGAGSAMQAIRATAREGAPGHWTITGDKSWSGNASWADVLVTFAQSRDAEDRPRGLAAFVVPVDAPGLRIGKEAPTMGLRAMVQNALRFDEVPATERLGDGETVANETMTRTRLMIGALCLGAMRRALQLQHRYARRREVGTGRLLDNPVTLARMTDSIAAVTAVQALVHDIAEELDGGCRPPDTAFLAVKVLAPELLWEVVDGAVQATGGRGYVETNVLPRLLRDARVLRIFEGPTESLRMHLGSLVAAGGGAGLVDADLVARVLGHCERTFAVLPAADRVRRAHDLLGEVAATAILLTAVRRHAADDHSEPWARRKFDDAVAKALGVPACAGADAVSAAVEGYEAAIGVVEQTPAGLDDELDPYLREDYAETAAAAAPDHPAENGLRDWLVRWVAAKLGIAASEVAGDTPFPRYGLDSVAVTELVGALHDEHGLTVPSALLWEYPTIDALSAQLDR